jgi:hypothetical protein
MGEIRTRELAVPQGTGSYKPWFSNDSIPITFDQGHRKMTDTIGFTNQVNGLESINSAFSPMRYSGWRWSNPHDPFASWHFDNVPVDGRPSDGNYPPLSTLPSPEARSTTVLSKSNPNRPAISIPVSFGTEMIDLPRQFKDLGDNLIGEMFRNKSLQAYKRAASRKGISKHDLDTASKNFLAINFGWVPLVQDITKMINIQRDVTKRFRELTSLYRKGGLHRHVTLDDEMISFTDHVAFQSSLIGIGGDRHTVVRRKTWGSVIWTPDAGNFPPDVSDGSQLRLAARLVGDLYGPSLDTVWRAIPFSWMANWFSNVGQVLNATRNNLSVTPSNMCLMTHVVNTVTDIASPALVPDFINDITCTDGVYVWETKERLALPFPTASFTVGWPILSAFQVSILGSLSAPRI